VMGRRGAGGKFLDRFSSRASEVMSHAAAGAQSILLRIVQNAPRPKKITAPSGLERLLEKHFLHPMFQTGG
jgi:hypothetical protein